MSLNQNNTNKLKNSFDKHTNLTTCSSTDLFSHPMYYIDNRVAMLGSSFDPTALAKLQFGNQRINNTGNLYPKKSMPVKNVNLNYCGQYILSDKIIKTDKFGQYFKFGKNKIYLQ